MALPYTIVLTFVGLAGIELLLVPMTDWFYSMNWLTQATIDAAASVPAVGH